MKEYGSYKKVFAAGLALTMAAWSFAGVFTLVAQAVEAHPAGTLVLSGGTVWKITDDGAGRMGFDSAEKFLSHRYDWSHVVPANSADLAMPDQGLVGWGSGVLFNDGGTVYQVAGGQKHGFTSAANFTGNGFSFANVVPGNLSALPAGANIDSTTVAHLEGTFVNDGGTVYMVAPTGKMGIPSPGVFYSWGGGWEEVVPANAADMALTNVGNATYRVGALVNDGGTIWAITSASERRGFPSASCFTGFGFNFGMVVAGSTAGKTAGANYCPADAPVPDGMVSVSLHSGTPAASVIPGKATGVPFLKFNLSNGHSSSATISQVVIKRSGPGLTTDFDQVYLYQGNNRLTSGRTVNSSTNAATFSGLNISVPAAGTITLDVLADMATSPTAGSVHRFEVESVTLSGGTVASGTAVGNNMTIASVTTGDITIAKSGTLTNPKVGEQNVQLAQFTLQAGGQEDLRVQRLTLYNIGSVSSQNLSNFVLQQAGTTVATASAMDSNDRVTFTLNFLLEKGNSRIFEVYADVSGSAKPAETIRIYLEESTDLHAVGQTYGYGVAVTRTGYDNSAGDGSDASWTTVEGGQVTFAFNGPAGKDIAKNDKDVEIFNFTVTSQANVEIRQLQLKIDGTDLNEGASTPNFTDIKVWDSSANTVVMGPQDLSGTASTTQTLTFTEDIMLSAGQSKTYKVTMDVANTAANIDGNTVKATLVAAGFTNQIRNLENNTFVTDIVPTSDLIGNDMTLRESGLAISQAGTPTIQSYVKGTQNAPAVGFVFTATTAKDVRVTGVTLTGLVATSTTGAFAAGSQTGDTVGGTVRVSDVVSTVRLMDGAAQVGTLRSPSSADGTVQFTGLNWLIPAGQSKTLVVQMNTNNIATAPDQIKFGLAASSVNAQDNDGNVVSISGLPVNTTADAADARSGVYQTIAAAGSLIVANAPSEIDVTDSHIVLAGQSAVTLAKYDFTAIDEDLELKRLRLDIGAGATSAVGGIALYDGANAITSYQTPTGAGVVDFSNISGFSIGKDATKTLTVRANMNPIVGSVGVSGTQVQVTLKNANFEVRGVGQSSTLITAVPGGDQAAVGTMVVRKTKPTVSLEVLPNETLTSGVQTIMKFRVSADSMGAVSLKQLTFAIATSSGVTIAANSLTIRESGAGVNLAATGTNSGGGDGKAIFTTEETIAAGASKTYEVRVNVTGLAAGSQSISTTINGDAAVVTTGVITSGVEVAGVAREFVWSDRSAIPHSAVLGGPSSADWTSGYMVRVLPSDPQTLIKN